MKKTSGGQRTAGASHQGPEVHTYAMDALAQQLLASASLHFASRRGREKPRFPFEAACPGRFPPLQLRTNSSEMTKCVHCLENRFEDIYMCEIV